MTATLTRPPGATQALYPEIEEEYLVYIERSFPTHAGNFVADMRTIWSERFSPEDYWTAINCTQSHQNLKRGILDELNLLSEAFPKIPAILWHCIAHVVFRENPYEKSSLLRDPENTFLCGDAVLNDTALHAAGIVTKLMHIINTRLSNRFGVIVVHGCGCDCCIEAQLRTDFYYEVDSPVAEELSKSFFGHLCAEWIKTKVLGLPFPIN